MIRWIAIVGLAVMSAVVAILSLPLEVNLILLLAMLPLADIAASVFFTYLFWISKHEDVPGSEPTFTAKGIWRIPILRWVFFGRSWLLALLAASCWTISIIYLYLTFLTARRLLGFPVIDGTQFITAFVLLALGTIPIVFAIAFIFSRRMRGTPPPFGDKD